MIHHLALKSYFLCNLRITFCYISFTHFNKHMADTKHLIVAVEGTATMARYWRSILSDYLKPIIRSFCGNEASSSEAANPNVELALVVFHARGFFSPCLIRQTLWITDMERFFKWLSALKFSGGDFCDVAIAEGLAEVITMFPSPNKIQDGHCILVAANNPDPLPTPVYQPFDNSEGDFESRLADAETVASSFPEWSISLSVICPMTLPKLKKIYNTGKRNPSATDHTIRIVKNPHYLVLISEDFVEACADLSQSGITKMTVASVSPVSETSSSVPPVNESPESTEVDPSSVSSPASALTFEHIPPVSCAISQEVSSLQTSAPSSTSHEIISSNDYLQGLELLAGVSANACILNKLSQARLSDPSGLSSSEKSVAMHMSSVKFGGITSSVRAAETRRLMPPPPPRTSHEEVQSQYSHSTFIKIWEGDLFCERGDRHFFVSRLEGYQISTSSDLLAEDWPTTMLIDRLIPKDFMTNNPHAHKAESLIFRSMDHPDTLRQFQEKKVCMVIRLPSHTLLMAVSERPCGLIAMLFPKDMVMFKPKISKQKQPASQQQQQQGEVSSSGPKA